MIRRAVILAATAAAVYLAVTDSLIDRAANCLVHLSNNIDEAQEMFHADPDR